MQILLSAMDEASGHDKRKHSTYLDFERIFSSMFDSYWYYLVVIVSGDS